MSAAINIMRFTHDWMIAKANRILAADSLRVCRKLPVQADDLVVPVQTSCVRLHPDFHEQRADRSEERRFVRVARPAEPDHAFPGLTENGGSHFNRFNSPAKSVVFVFSRYHPTNAKGPTKCHGTAPWPHFEAHRLADTSAHRCPRGTPRDPTRRSKEPPVRTVHFASTNSHRSRYGNGTIAKLRSTGLPKQERRFTAELANQLEAAGYNRLNDTPTGWGWNITVPDTATTPSEDRRRTWRDWSPTLLRNARDAKRANWTDAYAAKIFDLGDALERDGFQRIDDAPDEWLWVPGGRA